MSYVRNLHDLHNSLFSFFHPSSFYISPPIQRLQREMNKTAQTDVEQQSPSVMTPSVGATGGGVGGVRVVRGV